MKKGQTYEGFVEKCDFPNKGIIMYNEDGAQIPIQVKGAIKGQKIKFSLTKKRQGKCEGKVISIEEKSVLEDRKPVCGKSDICGGCFYQTVSYKNQLEIKRDMLKKLLDSVIDGEYDFEGIKSSPEEWNYRNKMEYTFGDEYKDGPLSLGLHKKKHFHDIVPATECRIVNDDYNQIVNATVEYFSELKVPFYHRMNHTGYLRHLVIRRTSGEGQILINLVTTGKLDMPDGMEVKKEEDILSGYVEKIKNTRLEGKICGIEHTINDSLGDVVKADRTKMLWGDNYIIEKLLGLEFKISTFSFFQTNTKGAEVLYEKAREYVGETKEKVVFDLYSGTGTIAQVLAPVAKKVVGVEIVDEAVESAKENAKHNKLENCEFLAGDVLKVIDEIKEKPDIIVLDPPREGVNPKALKKIINYGVDRMVYISCQPVSLAENLKLLQNSGYKVEKVCAVDMFPQTVHVETVVLLQKTDDFVQIFEDDGTDTVIQPSSANATESEDNKKADAMEPSENKKRFKGKKWMAMALIGIVAAASVVTASYFIKRPYGTVVLEAGKKLPDSDALLKNGQTGSRYKENYNIPYNTVGEYKIKLKNGLFTYDVNIKYEDTVAPVLKVKKQVDITYGEKLKAEDFVENVEDFTDVKLELMTDVSEDTLGYVNVDIKATDEGGNETIESSKLHILDNNINYLVSVEAGHKIKEKDFFVDMEKVKNVKYTFKPDLSKINTSKIGKTDVTLKIHGDRYKVVVDVADTTAPKAEVHEGKTLVGKAIKAEELVSEIEDETKTTVFFKEEPDFSKEAMLDVTVVVKDEYDNTTNYKTKIQVVDDKTPPVINGAADRSVYIGENNSLLTGVSASDNYDGAVKIKLDSSKVNFDKAGTYKATYYAIDSSGNRAEKTINVNVKKQRTQDDVLNEMTKQILASIINDKMTDRQKAKAIYDWAYANVGYVDSSDKSSWQKAAIDGLNNRYGDCYTSFAVAKALLTQAGIPNRDIQRSENSGNSSHHYWNLVNVGDGWYQFDTCRRYYYFDGFMFTTAQGDAYSASNPGLVGYYTYDKEVYKDVK